MFVVQVMVRSGGVPVEPAVVQKTFGQKLDAEVSQHIPGYHVNEEYEKRQPVRRNGKNDKEINPCLDDRLDGVKRIRCPG